MYNALNSAIQKDVGLPAYIPATRPGMSDKVFLGYDANSIPRYATAGYNPIYGPGILPTPGGGMANAPGYPQAAAETEGAKRWAAVPPAMFERGQQLTPQGVAPVPGYPQTQADIAGATAGATTGAQQAAQYGQPPGLQFPMGTAMPSPGPAPSSEILVPGCLPEHRSI